MNCYKKGQSMLVLIFFAFLAGIATVISPCVLPVLPAILSVSAGKGRGRPYGVIIGIVLSFVFFTLALTTLVRSFGISADILRAAAMLIIGFFGLVMILPALEERFARAVTRVAELGNAIQAHTREETSGFWSGFLLGIALGLVWTPCAGPILAAITALVATQRVTLDIVLLTFAYSLGSALPLLAITLLGKKALTSYPLLVNNTEIIRRGFGVVMIVTAVALAFHLDTTFQQKVLDYLPGIQIENNAWVESRLKSLRSTNTNFPSLGAGPFASQPIEAGAPLPMLAVAPPFTDISAWINSKSLSLETDLKGKVVLVDFWTYSCINCIRTLPFLKDWYKKYQDKGFVIVGVHTPEFEFEKKEANVANAVKRFGITYPVALDNQYGTWQAYNNLYWPAHYLIDQNGEVRAFHFGEGGYLETENGIRSLLGLAPMHSSDIKVEMKTSIAQTPETYLGLKRAKSYAPDSHPVVHQIYSYNSLMRLGKDEVGLKGLWLAEDEYIQSESDHSILTLNFMANRVYLVLGGESSLPIQVKLDGQPFNSIFKTVDTNQKGDLFVKEPRKYDVINLQNQGGRHVLTLTVPKGIQVYAFTFGME